MNTLQLKQTDGAVQVKSGDFGSRFAFQLLDEQGKVMTDLDGQVATVQLVSDDQISFETTAVVEGGEVAFRFNKLVSPGKHWLEIWVGDYIFPSDRKTRLKVIKAARERQSHEAELASTVRMEAPEADVPEADAPEADVPEAGEDVISSEAEVPADDVRPSPNPPKLASSVVELRASKYFAESITISGLEDYIDDLPQIVTASTPHMGSLVLEIIYPDSINPDYKIEFWENGTPSEEQTIFTTLYLEHGKHGEYRDAYPLTIKYIID